MSLFKAVFRESQSSSVGRVLLNEVVRSNDRLPLLFDDWTDYWSVIKLCHRSHVEGPGKSFDATRSIRNVGHLIALEPLNTDSWRSALLLAWLVEVSVDVSRDEHDRYAGEQVGDQPPLDLHSFQCLGFVVPDEKHYCICIPRAVKFVWWAVATLFSHLSNELSILVNWLEAPGLRMGSSRLSW